jgi:manganese oxidase
MMMGSGAYGPISMGGMFTILKVRKSEDELSDWYQTPKGTQASLFSETTLTPEPSPEKPLYEVVKPKAHHS